MKLTIFQRDRSRSRPRGFGRSSRLIPRVCGCSSGIVIVEEESVVETEFAFRCSGEISAHDDLAVNVGAEHGAGCGHQEVDVLDYIDEGFVFAVFDVGATPGEGSGGLLGDAAGVGGRVGDGGFDAFGGDVHFKGVCFGVLGVSEVEDFWFMGQRHP